MPSSIISSTRCGDSDRLTTRQESKRRLQEWLLDEGLDFQGRLIIGPAPWHSPMAQLQTIRNQLRQKL
ncbi:hypothetical protein Forpi1262_v005293 [Fusarium oxysporum f. sp. raphani]|uniref:Uncharacterized protein n=1 Tax=Fusarium oxysporum f. sp. raphani TaxID=96318 RepID=A0A8J5Q777_FUSOX|nr:hypothetical protein Forpi1262_v005293 [Fusarium oxysporum f. sp. raphani]KAK2697329.1 hypothetical protein QWA68_003579 [Fusarium oxysporum]